MHTPIITICPIPFIGTIYGIPEISLHYLNSPLSASFKFSIWSPFLNHSFSSGQITSSSLHSIVGWKRLHSLFLVCKHVTTCAYNGIMMMMMMMIIITDSVYANWRGIPYALSVNLEVFISVSIPSNIWCTATCKIYCYSISLHSQSISITSYEIITQSDRHDRIVQLSFRHTSWNCLSSYYCQPIIMLRFILFWYMRKYYRFKIHKEF